MLGLLCVLYAMWHTVCTHTLTLSRHGNRFSLHMALYSASHVIRYEDGIHCGDPPPPPLSCVVPLRAHTPAPHLGDRLAARSLPQGDPLSVLRQAFKTSLVQLDALEKQRAHLNVALDAQTKELHAFQGTCAAQNQQITAELRSLLQEVQDLKKCNAQQSAD